MHLFGREQRFADLNLNLGTDGEPGEPGEPGDRRDVPHFCQTFMRTRHPQPTEIIRKILSTRFADHFRLLAHTRSMIDERTEPSVHIYPFPAGAFTDHGSIMANTFPARKIPTIRNQAERE